MAASRRAEIFRQILPYINSGRYFEWEDHLVFGSMSFQEFVELVTGPTREQGIPRPITAFFKLASASIAQQGNHPRVPLEGGAA